MIAVNTPNVRHTMESEILKQALEGDAEAVNRALKYLSSANPGQTHKRVSARSDRAGACFFDHRDGCRRPTSYNIRRVGVNRGSRYRCFR